MKSPLKIPHVIAVIAVLLLTGIAAGGAEFPRPTGAVNDFAGVIPAESRQTMEALSREVLQKTGTAIVVATVATVGDSEPDEYANRLYEAWGIGKKGEDKGVLIFLAVQERRVRIETGYGVEGILPDGLTGSILDTYALPYFKKGDYGGGLSAAQTAVAQIIAKDAGVTLTGAAPLAERRTAKKQPEGGIFHLIVFLVIMGFLLGTRQGRRMLPFILLLMMSGNRSSGGDGYGGFGGGFGGFGGGSSGGGGAGSSF